jgi:hypothetical protein
MNFRIYKVQATNSEDRVPLNKQMIRILSQNLGYCFLLGLSVNFRFSFLGIYSYVTIGAVEQFYGHKISSQRD